MKGYVWKARYRPGTWGARRPSAGLHLRDPEFFDSWREAMGYVVGPLEDPNTYRCARCGERHCYEDEW